tara:strand:- start:31 stop:1800 length:1770 start_codon:yes stop_codon:yes gene_type:complete
MINLALRVLKCLNKSSIYKIFYLQLVTILIGLLSAFSAILIAPFIILISGEDLSINNPFFQKVFNLISIFNNDSLFLYVSIIFVSFYILSILLTLVFTFLNLKWIQDINVFFKKNLYSFFINKNWLFHSDISSKEIISKIHSDTERLANTVILPFINLISNFLIALIIIFAVFLVDFKVALISISIVSLFYFFFYYFFKKKLRKAGDTVTRVYPYYFKSMFEGFSSIKDVILFDKKNFFKNLFSENVTNLKNANITQLYLTQIPRSLIEIIFFILLIGFILALIKFYNFKFAEIGAMIAFYGICALKVIPALQKIFNSFASINSNLSAFINIEMDLINAKKISLKNEINEIHQKIKFQKTIKLNDITFTYPSNKKAGIFNVNMTIPYGSKIGIVGKTGSGKSTLLDLILGFITPNKGEIKVDETIINNKNIKFWQKSLSYVPQNFFIYEGTIKSNVGFGLDEILIENEKIQNSLLLAELIEFRDNENFNVGENGKRLSGGQKQRIGIARAIYKNSEILILDEATSALDTITERNILKNLDNNENIKTTIIVSHRFETLKMCDKLYFIENGKVEELKNFEELMSKYKDNK